MEKDNFESVRLHGYRRSRQPSRITVPARAHPLAKIVFSELRRQNATYSELEERSGVLISTFKAWRSQSSSPGLFTLQATLGALGWTLVAVPKIETLPLDVQDAIEDIGLHFRSDDEALATAIHAAGTWPEWVRGNRPARLMTLEASTRKRKMTTGSDQADLPAATR
jgi:transcriptional regulator with XRE-family HTH domain